jgi:hypothetical protein
MKNYFLKVTSAVFVDGILFQITFHFFVLCARKLPAKVRIIQSCPFARLFESCWDSCSIIKFNMTKDN